MQVTPAQRRLLDILVERPEWRLRDLAQTSGMDASTVHRHIRNLVDLGVVTRHRSDNESHISLCPVTSFFHIGEGGSPNDKPHWRLREWTVEGRLDWRYPLLSRLEDRTAQKTLVTCFDAVLHAGLVTPWLRHDHGAIRSFADKAGVPPERTDAYVDVATDPRLYEGLDFWVFGSIARGDEREESDIDLLIVTPSDEIFEDRIAAHFPQWKNTPFPFYDPTQELQDLVADLNLHVSRHIDAHYCQSSTFFEDLPEHLRHKILKEGFRVWATFPHGVDSVL